MSTIFIIFMFEPFMKKRKYYNYYNHILFAFSFNVLRYWQEHLLRIWISFIIFRGHQMNYDMHQKHEYCKCLSWMGCTFPIHFCFQILGHTFPIHFFFFFFFSNFRQLWKKLLDKYLKSVPSCPISVYNIVIGF